MRQWWAEGRQGRAGVQGTSKTNPLSSRCSRAPAADGPVPEIHPLGPGPPAPTGHRHPAPASVSQKLSTVPVRLRSSRGYPHAAGPGISWPRSTFRKARSSSPHGARTLSSLKRPGCVPTLEKEMSLSTVICCFGGGPPKSGTSLEATKSPAELLPADQDPAATGIDQRACLLFQENE